MSLERKKVYDVSDRSSNGREFQIVGAEKEKERRSLADFMAGTTSKYTCPYKYNKIYLISTI